MEEIIYLFFFFNGGCRVDHSIRSTLEVPNDHNRGPVSEASVVIKTYGWLDSWMAKWLDS